MQTEYAIQYYDGARWELELVPDSEEEPTRSYMAHLAAKYPAVKYRLVSRQVGDWETMDEEGVEK